MLHWSKDAVFYHIYPLGLCGAPPVNDFSAAPVPRIEKLPGWIDHLKDLGVNALYLGPVFESGTHGYDTVNYYYVDRRLGTNDTLKEVIERFHKNGIRVILDGVFHHVGRDFWAFKDLLSNLEASQYCSWFSGLDFKSTSPYGDPFSYDGWNGHFNLVKLNLSDDSARSHILAAVESWIMEFDIDGLRIDAADYIEPGFLKELSRFSKSINPEFWLLGEVIHGDYRKWINEVGLDSVTNYECFKGLFSSHNDKNYFEIAYSFNRQFSKRGLYRDFPIYNFADNHDVDRVASVIKDRRHLYTLYGLLFTMPGVPSVYYGSEWGIKGKKADGSDEALRPALMPDTGKSVSAEPHLEEFIGNLSRIRTQTDALRYGSYRQLLVQPQQFAFEREYNGEVIVAAFNAYDDITDAQLRLGSGYNGCLQDILSADGRFDVCEGSASVKLWPGSVRILRLER